MPEFRFVLVNGERQFPLGQRIELLDGHAACTHAEAAIKQVFQHAEGDWSDWHISIRDKKDEEFALLSITDTLGGALHPLGEVKPQQSRKTQ